MDINQTTLLCKECESQADFVAERLVKFTSITYHMECTCHRQADYSIAWDEDRTVTMLRAWKATSDGAKEGKPLTVVLEELDDTDNYDLLCDECCPHSLEEGFKSIEGYIDGEFEVVDRMLLCWDCYRRAVSAAKLPASSIRFHVRMKDEQGLLKPTVTRDFSDGHAVVFAVGNVQRQHEVEGEPVISVKVLPSEEERILLQHTALERLRPSHHWVLARAVAYQQSRNAGVSYEAMTTLMHGAPLTADLLEGLHQIGDLRTIQDLLSDTYHPERVQEILGKLSLPNEGNGAYLLLNVPDGLLEFTSTAVNTRSMLVPVAEEFFRNPIVLRELMDELLEGYPGAEYGPSDPSELRAVARRVHAGIAPPVDEVCGILKGMLLDPQVWSEEGPSVARMLANIYEAEGEADLLSM